MKNHSGYLFIFLGAVLWGIIGISVNGLADCGITRMQMVFLRTFIASLCMLPIMIADGKEAFRVYIKDLWCFAGTGIVSLFTFNVCYFNAMRYTTLSVAAVLLYTAPAFVMLLSALFFREKMNKRKWFVLALVAAGCVLVTGVIGDICSVTLPGILLGLGAGLGYALYSIFGRAAINRGYKSATVSFYTFLFCTAASIPFSDIGGLIPKMTSWPVIGYSLMISVLCCLLPYLLYTKGLETVNNSAASVIASAELVVATLVSVFVYSEAWSYMTVIGIVVLLCGVVLMNTKPKHA